MFKFFAANRPLFAAKKILKILLCHSLLIQAVDTINRSKRLSPSKKMEISNNGKGEFFNCLRELWDIAVTASVI